MKCDHAIVWEREGQAENRRRAVLEVVSEDAMPLKVQSISPSVERDYTLRLRQSFAADLVAKNLAEIHQADVLHQPEHLRTWANLTEAERLQYRKAATVAILLLDADRQALAPYHAMIALYADQSGTDGSDLSDKATTFLMAHYYTVTTIWRSLQLWFQGGMDPQQETGARRLRIELANRRSHRTLTDAGALPDVQRAIQAVGEISEADRIAPVDPRD